MSNGYETPTRVGGGSRGGRGGQTRVGSPTGQDLDEEQIRLNHRITRLDQLTAGHRLFEISNEGIMDLLSNDIPYEDFDEAVFNAIGMLERVQALEFLEGMPKDRQKWYFESLPVSTQNMLTRSGYSLPKDGFFSRAVQGFQDLIDDVPVVGRLNKRMGIAPISALGGVLSEAGEGLLHAIEADLNLAARIGRVGAHTFRDPFDITTPAEFKKYWDLAEYAETNFTPEAMTAARDQLEGNEEALEILLSIIRHGDSLEGALAHFEDKTNGDMLLARQKAEAFFRSPVVQSKGWYGASRYLNEGNVLAISDFPVWAKNQIALQAPPAFGGARVDNISLPFTDKVLFEGLKEKYKQGGDYLNAEEGWIPEEMWNSSRREDIALSKSGWATNLDPIIRGATELAAIIIFSPLNLSMTGVHRVLRARSGVKSPPDVYGGYGQQVANEYVASAAQRAMDDIAGVGKGTTTFDEVLDVLPDIIKANVTHKSGMTAGELRQQIITWAKENAKAGDTFFKRSSWWRREELRSINRKIDQINEAFRNHEKWLIQQQLRVQRGDASVYAPDAGSPIWELARQDPRFQPILEDMLRWHDEAKTIRGNKEFIEAVPAGAGETADYVFGQAKRIGVGTPGLDEFEGFWAYLLSEDAAGWNAFVRGPLGGRVVDHRVFPRLSWAGRIKLRHNLFTRKWFGTASDDLNNARASTFAVSVEESNAYLEQIIGTRITERLQLSNNPRLKALTQDEIIDIVVDPVVATERVKALENVPDARINVADLNEIKEFIEIEKNAGYETLYKIYRDVIVGNKSIEDLDYLVTERIEFDPVTGKEKIVEDTSLMDFLTEENLPYIDEYMTAHMTNIGVPQFNKQGVLKYPRNKEKLFRQGRQFVENLRRGLITTPGSIENIHLLRFPSEITPRTTKTWIELAESGLEVGPMRLNLEQAKINTPKQLQFLIEEKGVDWVAQELKVSSKELKKFIKEELHWLEPESVFWDSGTGQLTQLGIAAIYQTAYKTYEWSARFHRMVPKRNRGGMDLEDPLEAVTEFLALARMGTMSNTPTHVIDAMISRYIQAPLGERMNIVHEWLLDIIGRTGALHHGNENVITSINRYTGRQGTSFAVTGADKWDRGKLTDRASALFPTSAHAGQLSNLKAIPNWREVSAMTAHMGYMRSLGWKIGIPQADMLIKDFWSSSVVMKVGLLLKTALDELARDVLMHGLINNWKARLANRSIGMVKIHNEYGQKLELLPGTRIYEVDPATGKATTKQGMVAQAAGLAPVAVQNKYIWTPWLSLTRRLVQLGSGSRKRLRILAEAKAKKRFEGEWETLPYEVRRELIQDEQINMLKGGEGTPFISKALNNLMMIVEQKARILDPAELLELSQSPKDNTPVVNKRTEGARKILELTASDDIAESIALAYSHELVYNAAVEELYRPLQHFIEMTNPAATDEQLRNAATGLEASSVLYEVPMNMSDPKVRILNKSNEESRFMNAVMSHIQQWKSEPAVLAMADVLAHTIDIPLNGFFSQLLPDDFWSVKRARGRVAPLPDDFVPPPLLPVDDIDFIVEDIPTGAYGFATTREADPFSNATDPWVNEIHIDIGKTYNSTKFEYDYMTRAFRNSNAPSALRTLTDMGYHEPTLLKDLVRLGIYPHMLPYSDKFLELFNKWRVENNLEPMSLNDKFDASDIKVAWTWHHEVNHVLFHHSRWGREGWNNPALRLENETDVNRLLLHQWGAPPPKTIVKPNEANAHSVTRIISGGQTGADQGGLYAARRLGIESGGAAPARWITEKGESVWLKDYGLRELTTKTITEALKIIDDPKSTPKDISKAWGRIYHERTMWNVDNSDGTVVFMEPGIDTKGSQNTINYAKESTKKRGPKPVLVFRRETFTEKDKEKLLKFVRENNIKTLNIAGHRGSHVFEKYQSRPRAGKFKAVRPTKTLKMEFVFGEKGALRRATEGTTDNTFDAIKAGERTATTRKSGPQLDNMLPNDIIVFTRKVGNKTEKIHARVINVRKTSDTTPEEWAKLEGYLERDAIKNWTEGKKYGVGHTQIIFEYLSPNEVKLLQSSRDRIANFLQETLQAGIMSGGLTTKGIARLDAPTLDAILLREPNAVFLFGDNLQGRGKKGQAVVRDHPAAIGIPTKKYPGSKDEHFMTDAEFEANKLAIDDAFAQIPPGSIVYIPHHGLGTGFAKLKEKAPKTFEHLQMRIKNLSPKKPVNVHHTKGEGKILSNFAEAPFMFRGRRYLTAEGAYQAYKSGKHVPGFEKLKGTTAKKKGGSLTTDTKNDKNIDLMREILREKYEQVPEFREAVENAGVITHSVGGKSIWRDKFPELLEELKTPYAQRNEWEFQGKHADPPEIVDRNIEWAQKAYDLVSENGLRPALRKWYNELEDGIDAELIDEKIAQLVLDNRIERPQIQNFVRDLLNPVNEADAQLATRALAWLANDRIDATNLVSTSNQIESYLNKQLVASNQVFETPEGLDRLYSLRGVAAQDPVVARTMAPVARDKIELWYPQVNGEIGMHLAYLFSVYDEANAIPLAHEMAKGLIGFLTKELGNAQEAGQVFNLLNPRYNPNEPIQPVVWIDNELNHGNRKLQELIRQNSGAPIGSFMPLSNSHGLNLQAVNTLSVTANPLDAEKIRTALENWNTWLHETGGRTSSLMFDDLQVPAENLPLKRRLVSKAEYQGISGRTYGTKETWSIPRLGYANDVTNAPSIYLMGDDWANKQGVPRGWIEEMKDDIPTGKWIRESEPTATTIGPSPAEGFFGTEYPLPEVLPTAPASPPKTTIDKRLYLEEEIALLADSIISLPVGSTVNYLYSPLASYKEVIPEYDQFGHVVHRIVKLINQAGDEGWKVIQLEREIWRVLGDMPSVTRFDKNIDYIGTVGGTKAKDLHGPGLEEFNGIRRIFKDNNHTDYVPADTIVPKIQLRDRPFGDIAQLFEKELFSPWKGVSYAEAQFGAGGPIEYLKQRSSDFSGATFWAHKGARQRDPLEGRPRSATEGPPSGAEIQAYFEQALGRLTPEQYAEFFEWRKSLVNEKTTQNHFDDSWPFMRNIKREAGFNPEDAIVDGVDPQNFPTAFQRTVEELKQAGIPIDLTAMEDMPTITAALVRSKMRKAVKNNERTLWTWSNDKGGPLTPADIGGFHRGIKFMSVNPRTQLLQADQAAPDPHMVQIWKNLKTGQVKFIYDGKAVPAHMTEDGTAWRLQDEQYLSKYDMRALAEDRGIRMREELNHIATNAGRAKRMGTEINHPIVLELVNSTYANPDRLRRAVDRRLLPKQIRTTLPLPAHEKGVRARWHKIKEGWFRGVMHEGMKAFVREPMFFVQLHKALQGPAKTIKEFMQHSSAAYKPLEDFLNTATPDWVQPHGWTHGHTSVNQTNGVVQYEIAELYDMVAHIIPRLNLGDDMPSVFAHLMDDYMIGSRDKDVLLKEMFEVGDPIITIKGKDPYGLMKPGTSEYNPEYKSVSSTHFKYSELFESTERSRQLRKLLAGERRSKETWTGDPKIDGLHGTIQGDPVWEISISQQSSDADRKIGVFYRTYPETQEFFTHMYYSLGEETFMMKIDSLANWMVWSTNVINRYVEAGLEIAGRSTIPFVDNYAIRSEFQEIVGTLIPFHFAHYQMLSRWTKAAVDDPRIIPKLNWTIMAMARGGLLEKDEKTNQWRLTVPLGDTAVGWMAEVFTQVPVVGSTLGGTAGFVADLASMDYPFKNFIAGWDPENLGEFGFGPLGSFAVTALEPWIGPELMDDGLLGLEENFIVSGKYEQQVFDILFGAVIPKTISQPVCTLFNSVGATQICGDFAKAQVTAVMLMALEGDFPNETDKIINDSGEFSQDFVNAVNHRARDLLIGKTMLWEFVGTTPSPSALTTDDIWEWNPRFQSKMDQGYPFEEAYMMMYQEFKAEFDEDWEMLFPDEPVGSHKYLKQWYIEQLKFSVVVGTTTQKTVLSQLPTTEKSAEFLKDYGDWVMLNPEANSYLIPRGNTEGETEYESFAREWAIGEGLRTEKDWEEVAITLFKTVPNIIFYATKNKFDGAIDELRKAKKAGVPLPEYGFGWNTYDEAISRIELRFKEWKTAFQAGYPLWSETQTPTTNDGKRKATIESIGELLRVYNTNPESIPDVEHKTDILYGMSIVYNLSMNLQAYKDTDGIIFEGTDKTATEYRDEIKARAVKEFSSYMIGRPWLHNLYYSLLVPLIEEDWLIEYEVAQQEEDFVNLPELLETIGVG